MNDEEIMQSLEICLDDDKLCEGCRYEDMDTASEFDGCVKTLMRDAYNYIRKLKARIERALKCPFEIGNVLYVIVPYCFRCDIGDEEECLFCKNRGKYRISTMRVNSIRFDDKGYVLSENTAGSWAAMCLNCYERDFEIKWFTDSKAAEAKLERLQGD